MIKDLYSNKGLTSKQVEIRNECLQNFQVYVSIIAPYLQRGHCHEDLENFLQSEGTHKLVIYPRGHLKSKELALKATWLITRNPAVTILSASATADLSIAQLYDIKRILDSATHRKLFPELLGKTTEGTRSKWSQTAINVEHPYRAKLGVRDNTVYCAGAGKNIVGLHFDWLMLDDIIAPDTALDPFTPTGRDKAERWVSLAASILNPGGGVIAVGTRYHPKDIYGKLKNLKVPNFNDDGEIVSETPVYKIIEEVVEVNDDYLWPRKRAKDGNFYGFDPKELAKIKAQYIDTSQFYAQYYNDPTDPENRLIDPDNFQYYDKGKLNWVIDSWRFQGNELKCFAAMDMASTMNKTSDYTCLAVIGVDPDGFRYILDIKRIKTDKISVMSDLVYQAFKKWRFKKFRIETNQAQGLVANQIEAEMRRLNAIFSWDKQQSRKEKRLRIMSCLEPLYQGKTIFHFRGGNCEILEDELISERAPHDDVADAVAMCNEIVPFQIKRKRSNKGSNVIRINTRFGGVCAAQ